MSSIKIVDNSPAVTNLLKQRGSICLRTFADEVIKISTKKTPKDTGRLRMDIIRQVLGLSGKISWQKGYAAIQETTQFKNYTTPSTGPHFAEDGVKEAVGKTSQIAKKVGLA